MCSRRRIDHGLDHLTFQPAVWTCSAGSTVGSADPSQEQRLRSHADCTTHTRQHEPYHTDQESVYPVRLT